MICHLQGTYEMPSRMKNTASCATLQSEEAALSRRHVLWAAGAAGVAWRPARGVAQPADEVGSKQKSTAQ